MFHNGVRRRSNATLNVKDIRNVIALKAVPSSVISSALVGEKPCINMGFHALLMHEKVIFNVTVSGPLKIFHHTPFIGQNTINYPFTLGLGFLDQHRT